jgi:hypothetical protein
LSWLTRSLELELDYSLYFRKYLDHAEEDETSLSDTQRGRATAVFFPERDFSLILEDEYSRVTIDVRRPDVEENFFVNKSNLNRLLINPRYRYRAIATFEAVFDYRFEDFAYNAVEGDDAKSHTGSLRLSKELSRHFTANLDYSAEQRNNKWSDDYLRQSLTGGFFQQVSRRLTLEARGGAGTVDYDHRNAADTTIFIGEAAVRYALSPRLRTRLRYSEDFAIATIDGLFQRRLAEAGLSYGAAPGADDQAKRLAVDLAFAWTRDDYLEIDREDRSLGVALTGRLPLARNLALLASGYYRDLTFRPESENVDRYGLGSGLEYRLRRLRVTLNYLYRDSDSDIQANDYRNNIVALAASLHF